MCGIGGWSGRIAWAPHRRISACKPRLATEKCAGLTGAGCRAGFQERMGTVEGNSSCTGGRVEMEPTKCTEQEKAIAAVAASQCTIPNCEACAAPPFSLGAVYRKGGERHTR